MNNTAYHLKALTTLSSQPNIIIQNAQELTENNTTFSSKI